LEERKTICMVPTFFKLIGQLIDLPTEFLVTIEDARGYLFSIRPVQYLLFLCQSPSPDYINQGIELAPISTVSLSDRL
jgi:hypothetical protein